MNLPPASRKPYRERARLVLEWLLVALGVALPAAIWVIARQPHGYGALPAPSPRATVSTNSVKRLVWDRGSPGEPGTPTDMLLVNVTVRNVGQTELRVSPAELRFTTGTQEARHSVDLLRTNPEADMRIYGRATRALGGRISPGASITGDVLVSVDKGAQLSRAEYFTMAPQRS